MASIFVVVATTAAVLGCGDVSAVDCGDGTFCPAGTECEQGRCLAAAETCAEFAVNSPCRIGADGRGFCAASSCAPGVAIRGQAIELSGNSVVGATVEAIDRAWIDPDVIEIGTFEVLAPAFESDLVLRFRVSDRLDMLSRRIDLTDVDFVFNEDENEPLRMTPEAAHKLFTEHIGETHDTAKGLLAVRLIRPNGSSLGQATASLVGGQAAVPLYFTSGTQADPDAVATSSGAGGSGLVIFPFVEPGFYTLEIDHPVATVCRATGDLVASEIRVDVVANTLTNVGDVVCAPPS